MTVVNTANPKNIIPSAVNIPLLSFTSSPPNVKLTLRKGYFTFKVMSRKLYLFFRQIAYTISIMGERMIHMDLYKITSFKPTGELVVDENFEAENDDVAKTIGEQKLQELGIAETTHRVVSPRGKLILFHV